MADHTEQNTHTISYHASIVDRVAERVKGGIEHVLYWDASFWYNLTAEANDPVPNDVPMAEGGIGGVSDLYIGQGRKFDRMEINITTAPAGPGNPDWEYWDGSAWAKMDNPSTLHWINSGFVTGEGPTGLVYYVLSPPPDWERTTVQGISTFWIRFHKSGIPDYTQAPIAGQIWVSSIPAVAAPGRMWTVLLD